MTAGGTAAHESAPLPPWVRAAVDAARRVGFAHSCLPGVGALLRVLAAGVVGGRIGETGTGCGVGLAWLVDGAGSGTTILSVEHDADRAMDAKSLFAHLAHVEVMHGDAAELLDRGPFDLLVLDGGPGSGKMGEEAVDPKRVLTPGGLLVIDDFTPSTSWPPRMPDGTIDDARVWWLTHPDLHATEILVAAEGTAAVLLARRRRPGAPGNDRGDEPL